MVELTWIRVQESTRKLWSNPNLNCFQVPCPGCSKTFKVRFDAIPNETPPVSNVPSHDIMINPGQKGFLVYEIQIDYIISYCIILHFIILQCITNYTISIYIILYHNIWYCILLYVLIFIILYISLFYIMLYHVTTYNYRNIYIYNSIYIYISYIYHSM